MLPQQVGCAAGSLSGYCKCDNPESGKQTRPVANVVPAKIALLFPFLGAKENYDADNDT
jgi:hypothetical protein